MQRAANLPTLKPLGQLQLHGHGGQLKFNPVYVESLFVCHAEPQHPIFAGGKRRADIKQAKLNLSKAAAREYRAYAPHR